MIESMIHWPLPIQNLILVNLNFIPLITPIKEIISELHAHVPLGKMSPRKYSPQTNIPRDICSPFSPRSEKKPNLLLTTNPNLVGQFNGPRKNFPRGKSSGAKFVGGHMSWGRFFRGSKYIPGGFLRGQQSGKKMSWG